MRNLTLLIVLLNNKVSAQSEAFKSRVAWFQDAKYGIFVHYLEGLQNSRIPWDQGKRTSWNKCVNEFNVRKFANDASKAGAGYVIFTLQQGNKYFCIPEKVYEKYTGYKRGTATVKRDLVNDLYNALHAKGIKLMLYITGDGPKNDVKASRALNNPSIYQSETGNRFTINPIWVERWSNVIKDISLKYKEKISGWWADGCYSFIGYNDKYLSELVMAMKAGNPNAIVALNNAPGPKVRFYSKLDDYTAGEMDSFVDTPISRFLNGAQWHILSYLGPYWAQPGARYSNEYMANYIKKCNKYGGVVTMDICLLRDGSINPPQLAQLEYIKQAIRE